MLEDKVLEFIKRNNLIEPNDRIVLGVSGVQDSITLLHILNNISKNLNFKIVVAHVNHGIREEATEDEQYVENWCKKLDIPFFVLHAEVEKLAKLEKVGTEEMGRKVRKP